MTATTFVATLLLAHYIANTYADISVNLSPSNGESKCGETISINPGNESSVFATRKVPDGHCSLYFRTTQNDDYECDKFCITFRKKTSKHCYVKVKFTAIKFDSIGDQSKVYDCWHSNAFDRPWCPTTKKLQMEILESESYHYNYEDVERSYDFSIDITPVCSPKKMVTNKSAKNSRKKNADRMEQIKVEGIVVGVCLACIFLVLLVVMYMYYKSKPTDNIPEENEPKRGRIFSSIRNTFGNRRKSNVVRNERDTFDKYEEVKQTDDDIATDIPSRRQSSSSNIAISSHGNKKVESSPV